MSTDSSAAAYLDEAVVLQWQTDVEAPRGVLQLLAGASSCAVDEIARAGNRDLRRLYIAARLMRQRRFMKTA